MEGLLHAFLVRLFRDDLTAVVDTVGEQVSEKMRKFKEKLIMTPKAVDIQDVSGSQSIQIPDTFKIDDDKVYLKKVGNVLYIIPFHNPWQNLFNSVNAFTEDFMKDREQPEEQNRESFD